MTRRAKGMVFNFSFGRACKVETRATKALSLHLVLVSGESNLCNKFLKAGRLH